jgi:predicted nucleic acid-binding protein
MILADTSVWVEHLRGNAGQLAALLERGMVVTHPFVIGELVLGGIRVGSEVFELLHGLPGLSQATPAEILHFIDKQHLAGQGAGYVDVHLLASAILHDMQIYTLDKRLERLAESLGVGFKPAPH